MATEQFDPDRLELTMQHSTVIHREAFAELVTGLAVISPNDAIELVACAGEDERHYRRVAIDTFLSAFVVLADEFLADDDGGYHEMSIQVARRAATSAAIEMWFHVRSPGSGRGGVWMRHIVVRTGEREVVADIGAALPDMPGGDSSKSTTIGS